MNTNGRDHGGKLLANAVRLAYQQGQTDYSMEPFVRVDQAGKPVGMIQDGDSVVFCCRRGEREVELTEAFTESEFPHFDRSNLTGVYFVILTLYHEKFKDLPVAFAPVNLADTLGELVSRENRSQMRCSESEKFAHVTFFLNGGNNRAFPGEMDVRIPSPKGQSYETIPELSLPRVTEEVIQGIQKGYDLIITNFANGDVIGHTSSREAKIQCAAAVDVHLGRVVEAAMAENYVIAITADHGNLEEMVTAEGAAHVAHTANPVPFLLIDPQTRFRAQVIDGSLSDIAPTILGVLDIPVPESMTGTTLAPGHEFGPGRKMLLIILDGWGIGREDSTNPIYLAETPVWDRLVALYPPSRLQASGEAVGLKAGKTGNSEAGHMNIGAGRVVLQDDVRLDQAMKDGSFYTNEVILKSIRRARENGTSLHLIGLLTEKSSHGSMDYPLAILQMAKDQDLERVFVHIIFDGRSTEPGSAPDLLEKMEIRMREIGIGEIVSGIGRGIALDRDGNYGRIEKTYRSLVQGIGHPYPDVSIK